MTTLNTVNSLTLATAAASPPSVAIRSPRPALPSRRRTLWTNGAALNTLTLTNGGLEALSGNGGIINGVLATGAAATLLNIHVASGASLNLNAYTSVSMTGGLTKSDAGSLSIGKTSFLTGQYNLTQGTVTLAATADLGGVHQCAPWR